LGPVLQWKQNECTATPQDSSIKRHNERMAEDRGADEPAGGRPHHGCTRTLGAPPWSCFCQPKHVCVQIQEIQVWDFIEQDNYMIAQ